jgi:hypothetical protein
MSNERQAVNRGRDHVWKFLANYGGGRRRLIEVAAQ